MGDRNPFSTLFWLSPTYTVLLSQILTREPNVDSSAAENKPQQMHYVLLTFDKNCSAQLFKEITEPLSATDSHKVTKYWETK